MVARDEQVASEGEIKHRAINATDGKVQGDWYMISRSRLQNREGHEECVRGKRVTRRSAPQPRLGALSYYYICTPKVRTLSYRICLLLAMTTIHNSHRCPCEQCPSKIPSYGGLYSKMQTIETQTMVIIQTSFGARPRPRPRPRHVPGHDRPKH